MKNVVYQKTKGFSSVMLFAQSPIKDEFAFRGGLERHIQNNKHSFAKGISARDKVVMMVSKPGCVLAMGALPDRQVCVSEQQVDILDTVENNSYENGMASSFGKFNRKKGNTSYKKPAKLTEVLTELYNRKPKLKANEMKRIMENMIDPEDGGYMFCISKSFTTGMLLSENVIQQFINSMTQKKKS